MIFVTVGTHYLGFDRLIQKMDEIASRIDENVIMQIGYTNYEPKNAEWIRFLKYDEIKLFFREANLIISHAGAGTLLDVLNLKKTSIVVPRLKKYGEHIDNQQIELAEALGKTKRVITVYDVSNLEAEIDKISKIETIKIMEKSLIKFLNSYTF